MQRLFHGWLSLVLIGGLVGIGYAGMYRESPRFAPMYLAVVAVSLVLILRAFCSKCPCREHGCRHVILGPLTRLLPRHTAGEYSSVDLTLTAVGIAGIALFPQYGLSHSLPLLVGFWATAAALLLEIIVKICPGCGNSFCPMAGRGRGDRSRAHPEVQH